MNKHSSIALARSSASHIKLTAVALLAAGLFTTVQAQVISFDFTPNNGLAFGTTPTAMSPADLAGAPGARVGNWNMISSTSYSSSSTVDSTGATVARLNVSLSASGSAIYTYNNNSGSADDYTMYNTLMDISSSASISLTSIPYAAYDLIFYLYPDTTSSSPRGGDITVGGTTCYVNGGYAGGGNAVAMPDSSGNGYVLSTATTAAASLAAPGNYVEFTGLTDSSLTANLASYNFGDGVPRLKMSGFQIVAVPEPSTCAMLGLGLGMFRACGFGLRRRKNR